MTEHSVYAANMPHYRISKGALSTQTAHQATRGVEVVYYLRLANGLIKIGTSRRVLERLATHKRKSGVDEVLAVEFGGRDLERQRHQQFASDLAQGRECFNPSPALLAHIDDLRHALGLTG